MKLLAAAVLSLTLLGSTALGVLVFSTAAVGQQDERGASSEPEVMVWVTGPIDSFEMPQGSSRLAFSTNETVHVMLPESELVTLGGGSDPEWSNDGRFLVWGDHAFGTTTNVYVLDTEVGQRFVLSSEDRGFSGEVLLAGTTLIAPTQTFQDEERFGPAFYNIDMLALGGDEPTDAVRFVEVNLVDDHREPSELDTFAYTWDHAIGDGVYLTRSRDSGTWYRYEPEVWRASLASGDATYVFNDCASSVEGCFGNYGFHRLQFSPNQDFVAYQGGGRDGCDAWTSITLRSGDGEEQIVLRGFPEFEEDRSLQAYDLVWLSDSEFRVVLTAVGMPQGEERCTYPELLPPTPYVCTTAGECTPTGDPWPSVENDAGDFAVVHAEPGPPFNAVVTIEWATGDDDVIIASRGSLAWSPVGI